MYLCVVKMLNYSPEEWGMCVLGGGGWGVGGGRERWRFTSDYHIAGLPVLSKKS